jgi:hypothetical protein
MALKLKLEQTQFGVPAPEAYAKVTNFWGNASQLQVQVAIYYDADARKNNLATVKESAYYINIEDLKGDIMPAIYNVLKTYSDYADATDA